MSTYIGKETFKRLHPQYVRVFKKESKPVHHSEDKLRRRKGCGLPIHPHNGEASECREPSKGSTHNPAYTAGNRPPICRIPLQGTGLPSVGFR